MAVADADGDLIVHFSIWKLTLLWRVLWWLWR